MYFDSHCHLTSEVLAVQLDEMLQRMRAADVTRVLNIGDTLATSQAALAQIPTAQAHGIEMWVSVGVHPQNALRYEAHTLGALRKLASDARVAAIGEIGLDYVYDDQHEKFPGATRAVQEAVLRAQLDLARELALPVIIHNREADEALLRVLREYSGLRGVFHCFSSSLDVARQALDLGFYLGFTGLVTFKSAEAVREVARFCPLDRMLVETDAPYLAPVPHRGKTNEPSFVPLLAAYLAELLGNTPQAVGEITTRNALELLDM